jgi:hypothetical protein
MRRWFLNICATTEGESGFGDDLREGAAASTGSLKQKKSKCD